MSKIKSAIILAGGMGTRLAEQTHSIPKPLVEVGGKPILLHVINHLVAYGVENIIIAGGYKVNLIREYFLSNAFKYEGDLTIEFNGDAHAQKTQSIRHGLNKIIVADTGLKTNTAQRIKRAAEYLEDGEDFYMLYGDNISDVNLHDVAEGLTGGTLAVLTAVRYQERFGILHVGDSGQVTKFVEKSMSQHEFINGGFMACSHKLPALIPLTDGDFSKDTLPRIQAQGKLHAHLHNGFWAAMDTQRDYEELNKTYEAHPEYFII